MRLHIPCFDRDGNETGTRRAWLDDLLLAEPDLSADTDALLGDAR